MTFDARLIEILLELPVDKRLKRIFQWLEISADSIAQETGIHGSYISRFVNGDYKYLRGARLRRVLEALEVPQELFAGYV